MKWKRKGEILSCLLLLIFFVTSVSSQRCNGSPEIVLVLDSSGNQTEAEQLNWLKLQTFANSMVDRLGQRRSSTRFALVTFSEGATTHQALTSDRNTIKAAINATKLTGYGRNQARGFRNAQDILFDARTPSDKYVILVATGATSLEEGAELTIAKRLIQQGVRVIVIAIGSDLGTVETLVSRSNIVRVRDYEYLSSWSGEVERLYTICPQEAKPCTGPPEVVLILDSSGSIIDKGPRNWELMRNFGTDLVSRLGSRQGIKMAFIMFSDTVKIMTRLTSDLNKVRRDIQGSQIIGGFTNQADALRAVQDVLLDARKPSSKLVIMVTDGAPTQNQGQESQVARRLRSQGVSIVMIGVTNQINDTNLRDLAGPEGAVFKTADFESLRGEATKVISAAAICPPDAEPCEGDPEVIIILDSSGSITDKGAQNWPLMKKFGNGIIDGLKKNPGIRFAYIQFSNDAFIRSELTSNITAIQTKIETSVNLRGFTNQAAALRLGQVVFYQARVNSTKHIIFVTDGEPTAEVGVEASLAQVLRNQGVNIISIGVTSDRNVTNLRKLAGPTGLVFEDERFEDLGDRLATVISAAGLCPEPGLTCEEAAEIVIVLDASGSIVDKGPNNWDLMRRFVSSLVSGLSKKGTRFALVRFSNEAEIDLELTDSIVEVQAKIRNSKNMGGFTNQYDALRKTQNILYNVRINSSKYIIFITDGSPTMEQGREAKLARSLREQGVAIIAIGVTDERNTTNLRSLAGPVGAVFETEQFTSLDGQVASVISAASICFAQPDICVKPPDIVLVIDASGSIIDKDPNNWDLMKRFGENIVTSLQSRNGSRFAVVRFSSEALIDMQFTSDATKVKEVIRNISNLEGFTNQYDALVKTQEVFYLGRNNSARYIIFITDGEPTMEPGRESRIALSLRRQGVKFIMIGVTKEINETNLYDLAGDTGDVFESETFENLGQRITNVLTASNVCPPQSEPCGGPPEMVLVLDASDSEVKNGPESWNGTKAYTANLLEELRKRGGIRFGFVKYGQNKAVIESNLTSDSTAIQRLIKTSTYLGGDSNLEAALLAAKRVLEESRSRAARYIVLIAHGASTTPGNEVEISKELGDSGILIVTIWVHSGTLPVLQAQETRQSFQELTTDRGAAFETLSFIPLDLQTQQIVAATNVCPSTSGTCYVTNIVFAIDESGSIRDKGADNFNLLKEFVVKLARGISYRIPDARYGLVVFSNRATIVKELDNTDIDQFVAMVRTLRFLDGETNLADAVEKSWDVVKRNSTGKAQIIIITDGEPNVRKGEEISIARKVRSFGVGISAIGVTNKINNNTLENLAGTMDTVFYADTFQDLTNQVTPVLEASCKSKPTTAGNCSGEPDIVFVIDSSGSITERNSSGWQTVKNLLSRTITQFAQGNANARFGAVRFSESAQVVFQLTRNVNAALRAIAQMPYSGSFTNIADGIRVARQAVFNESRSNANKIMIIITDGKSNVEAGKEIDEATISKITPFNIRIVTIGVTEEPDFIVLQQVATDSAAVIQTPSYQVLTNEIDRIINISCSNHSCAGPPDIILILDSSGSITDKGSSNWRYLQRFSQQLITGLSQRRDPRFAYVQFSDGALIRDFFTGDPEKVLKSIRDSSHINGWTNQAAALRTARELLYDARPNAVTYVIMVTDGYPTVEIGAESGVARQLRDIGTRMIMIGVTNDTNERNLRDLSGYTGQWFYSKDFINLNNEVYGVISAAEECPAGPSPCDARDVVIALQVTKTINNRGPNAFRYLQDFAINITQSMYQRYPDIRFGLVTFSGVSKSDLNIADYRKISDIEKAINSAEPRGDTTNVGEAISTVRKMIERQANRAPQMILIAYEQSSNINDFNQAQTARGVGIKIVGVGISNDRSYFDYMQQITSASNNTVVVTKPSDLQFTAEKVIKSACTGGAKPQPPVICTGPTDMVFALDASGSITERNKDEWDNAKALLYTTIQLISKNNPDTQFGAVVFSTTSDVEFKLKMNITDALNDIREIKYRGSRTNIAAAIEQARMEVFPVSRSNARKIMVIITDGKSNERINEEFVQASISQGYPYNISVIVIGITAEPDYETLEALSSDPTRVIRSANFAILANEVQRIVNVACAVNFAQDPILDNIVDPTCAPLMLDVVLLVDSSGSVIRDDPNDQTWPKMKDTLATIVDGFPSNLGKDGVQVALAQFSDYTRVKFTLNRYSSPLAIKSRISDLQNMRWSTNIADALKISRKYLFNSTSGDRPKARNVIVLLSDGEASGRQWDTNAEAETLKRMGVNIVVVGFTEFTDSYVESNLRNIATNRDFYISYKELRNNTSIVNQKLCRLQ